MPQRRWSFVLPFLLFNLFCAGALVALLSLFGIPFGMRHLAALLYFLLLGGALHHWQEAALATDAKVSVQRFMTGMVIKMLLTLFLLLALAPARPAVAEQVVTLYFGGTTMTSVMSDPAQSPFKRSEVVAHLYADQRDRAHGGPAKHHKLFINGIGTGSGLALDLLQASSPSFDLLRGWSQVLNEAITFINGVYASTGDTIRLTLYWRAREPIWDSWKVFNQVYFGDSPMIAQRDGYPVCDTRETWRWDPGELITDVYDIPVNPDAPDGLYPLYTGLYLEETNERLPVLDETGAQIDTQVHVTDIRVGEE